MTPKMLEDIRAVFNLNPFRGKTYGDFLIPPKDKNTVGSRSNVELKTKFSKNISLNQPIVSANMLDVTESRMAIKNAMWGGLGIIHRFCPIDYQVNEVEKTKRAHNFIIPNPYKISESATLEEAVKMMAERNVGSLLVYDANDENRLVGILTRRDIRFLDKDAARTAQVANRMTARKETKVIREGEIEERRYDSSWRINNAFVIQKVKKLPIVDGADKIRGLICAKDLENLDKYKLANLDNAGQLVVGGAIGAVGDYIERAQELVKAGANVLVLDVTSVHADYTEEAIEELYKKLGDDLELVVGNAGTSEQAKDLIKWGAKGIKVGIGPGGVCTTRNNTGIGVPQLHAVLEIYWNLTFKYGYEPEDIPPLCADGGIRRGADIVHALMGGASSAMIGTMFAGTEETPGDIFTKQDGRYKRIRGMASREALIARYEADGIENPIEEAMKKSPEGMEREVKVTGSVENIIKDLMGGIQSAVSHRGVKTLQDAKDNFNPFDKESGFIVLSEQARRESYERGS